jgi:hypothetical protein
VYRGGTWLSPFHRMVPLPRSFAADAHGCIMVTGRHGPTEYKVVARRSALVARLRSDHLLKRFGPAAGGWTGNAPRQGSRFCAPALRLTALTRPRSQSVSLVIASARGADARSKQERDQSGDVALDNKHPIQGTSRAPLRLPRVRRCASRGSLLWTTWASPHTRHADRITSPGGQFFVSPWSGPLGVDTLS